MSIPSSEKDEIEEILREAVNAPHVLTNFLSAWIVIVICPLGDLSNVRFYTPSRSETSKARFCHYSRRKKKNEG